MARKRRRRAVDPSIGYYIYSDDSRNDQKLDGLKELDEVGAPANTIGTNESTRQLTTKRIRQHQLAAL